MDGFARNVKNLQQLRWERGKNVQNTGNLAMANSAKITISVWCVTTMGAFTKK